MYVANTGTGNYLLYKAKQIVVLLTLIVSLRSPTSFCMKASPSLGTTESS